MTSEFVSIYYPEARKGSHEGKLRIAQQGIAWKSTNDELVAIEADQLDKLQWSRCSRSYQFKIILKNGSTFKFENFDREAFVEVKDAVKLYHITLEVVEYSVQGWNWGKTELKENSISFQVNQKTMFEIPFQEISNAYSGKNEVTVEISSFVLDSNPTSMVFRGPKDDHLDQLVECRFHVPGMSVDAMEVEDEELPTAAEHLCQVLKSKTQFETEKDETIVSFKELPFLTPRGRYDVDMFPDFLRLRGKSYDYKILYGAIQKLYLLPKPDDVHVLFVISLDPPVRQGQTRYPFLVLQFVREDEIHVDLKIQPELIASKYENKIQSSYDAPTFEVVSSIFRAVTRTKILVPGTLRSPTTNGSVVKCSFKANEGLLYALDRSFLFIPKPTIPVPHEDISHVTFSRVSSGSLRTFDLSFTLKSAPKLLFSNILREEHQSLLDFFQNHDIKVSNELQETNLSYLDYDSDGTAPPVSEDEDPDESDEEFVVSSSDESKKRKSTSDQKHSKKPKYE